MDPRKTAVVFVELQNDFLSPEGKLHSLVNGVIESNELIPHANSLISQARGKGSLIVHTPILFSSDYREMGDDPYGIMKVVKDAGAFQKGSWGAEIAPSIELQPSDVIIDGKSSIDAFSGTNLDFVLRSHGITTLALGGLLTHICIESTMRSAYERGYQVYTLTDTSATIGPEEQRIAVQYTWPMFSHPVTHKDLIHALN